MSDADIFARTLYGEAEAGNKADAIAIARVILNRMALPNWPSTASGVCLQPWQFSCWNANDPNRQRILNAKGAWWEECQHIAKNALSGKLPPDQTSRSTHYYANWVKMPKWAKGKEPVLIVPHESGNAHLFFNNIDTPPPKTPAEALDQQRPLSSSRTVKGGQIAAIGTTGSAGVTVLEEAAGKIQPIASMHDILMFVFILLTLAGLGWMLWARLDDREEGLR